MVSPHIPVTQCNDVANGMTFSLLFCGLNRPILLCFLVGYTLVVIQPIALQQLLDWKDLDSVR
jgi:hypothetical protein